MTNQHTKTKTAYVHFSTNSAMCGAHVGHPYVSDVHYVSDSEPGAALAYMIGIRSGAITGPCPCGSELTTFGQMRGIWETR